MKGPTRPFLLLVRRSETFAPPGRKRCLLQQRRPTAFCPWSRSSRVYRSPARWPTSWQPASRLASSASCRMPTVRLLSPPLSFPPRPVPSPPCPRSLTPRPAPFHSPGPSYPVPFLNPPHSLIPALLPHPFLSPLQQQVCEERSSATHATTRSAARCSGTPTLPTRSSSAGNATTSSVRARARCSRGDAQGNRP